MGEDGRSGKQAADGVAAQRAAGFATGRGGDV